MDDVQFMGLLIGAIASLLGIASIIVAILVKPVINLNKSITKLNESIDHLNGQNKTLEGRVSKHGEEIDDLDDRMIVVETKLNIAKEGKKR